MDEDEERYFVDSRKAFPTLSLGHLVTDELRVYPGELVIRWYELMGSSPSPKLEVFDESWKVLADSGLVPLLAEWPENLSIEDAKARLVAIGYVDHSPFHANQEPRLCPTCRGVGWVRP